MDLPTIVMYLLFLLRLIGVLIKIYMQSESQVKIWITSLFLSFTYWVAFSIEGMIEVRVARKQFET